MVDQPDDKQRQATNANVKRVQSIYPNACSIVLSSGVQIVASIGFAESSGDGSARDRAWADAAAKLALSASERITASGVKKADALPAVHQGQETEASDLSAPSSVAAPTSAITELRQAFEDLIAEAPLDFMGTGSQASARLEEKQWEARVLRLRVAIEQIASEPVNTPPSAIGAPAWMRLDNYAEAVNRWGGDGVRLDRHASHFVYYVDETTQWWGFQVKYLPSAHTDRGAKR